MKQLNLPMSAGETKYISVAATFMRVVQGVALHISINDDSALELSALMAVTKPAGINRLSVFSPVAQMVKIVVGDGVLHDARVQSDNLAEAFSGGLFIGAVSQTAAAGQFAGVQFVNPGGSGKNVVLGSLILDSASWTSTANFGMIAGGFVAPCAPVASATSNCLSGGQSSAVMLGGGSMATVTAFSAASGPMQLEIGQASPLIISQQSPLIILPGYSFYVIQTAPATLISAVFQWTEISVTNGAAV